MKKMKKVLSVILCVAVVLGSMSGVTAFASSVGDAAASIGVNIVDNLLLALCHTLDKTLEFALNTALGLVNLSDTGAQDVSEYENPLFEKYDGHDEFADEAAADAAFSLGYDKRDIIPDDFYDGAYYKYGAADIGALIEHGTTVNQLPSDLAEYYADQYAAENGCSQEERDAIAADLAERYAADVLSVRTVCLDDSRGKVLIASVDSIGLTNASKNAIVALVDEYCTANGIDDIVSINVTATHTHSAIDTLGILQGVGQVVDGSLFENLFTGAGNAIPDPKYMDFLHKTVAESMIAAYGNMEKGSLHFTKADDTITFKDATTGEERSENFFQPGADTTVILEEIYKLTFVPAAKSSPVTVIANFAVHPEKVGVSTSEEILPTVSADMIPYMEQRIVKAYEANGQDCNFIYINSAIGSMIKMDMGINSAYETYYAQDAKNPIYDTTYEHRSMRYGIVLGDYIASLPLGEEGDPILNVKTDEILVKTDNFMLRLLAIVKLTNNVILTDADNSVYTVSEVGYMEIGKNIKIFMCPGEINPELIATDDHLLSGDYSLTRADFQYEALINYFDETDEVLVFGLMNDMAGYIDPDNDYSIALVRLNDYGTPGEYGIKANANALLFSYSSDIASTLIGTFLNVVNEANGGEAVDIIEDDFTGTVPYINYIMHIVNHILKTIGL